MPPEVEPGVPGWLPGGRAELSDRESPVEPDEPDEVDDDELEELDEELDELDEDEDEDDGELGMDGLDVEGMLGLDDIPAHPLRTSDAPTSRPGSFERVFMAIPQEHRRSPGPGGFREPGALWPLDAFGRQQFP